MKYMVEMLKKLANEGFNVKLKGSALHVDYHGIHILECREDVEKFVERYIDTVPWHGAGKTVVRIFPESDECLMMRARELAFSELTLTSLIGTASSDNFGSN